MLTKDDKKWISGNSISKKDLKKELKSSATKEDLKKFATKDDSTASNVRLGVEFDKKIDVLREESRSDHDEVMTALDEVVRELVRGREHDLVVAHQIEKLNKQVFA